MYIVPFIIDYALDYAHGVYISLRNINRSLTLSLFRLPMYTMYIVHRTRTMYIHRFVYISTHSIHVSAYLRMPNETRSQQRFWSAMQDAFATPVGSLASPQFLPHHLNCAARSAIVIDGVTSGSPRVAPAGTFEPSAHRRSSAT